MPREADVVRSLVEMAGNLIDDYDELFELQAQEGPCLDAFRTGMRVEHEDLQAGSGRWPSFSAAALTAGFRSASAVPLRLRHDGEPWRS